jgi:hypothetical protein
MKKRNKKDHIIYQFTDTIFLSSDRHNFIVSNDGLLSYFTSLDQAFYECYMILLKQKLTKKQCQSLSEILDIIKLTKKEIKTNIKKLESIITLD